MPRSYMFTKEQVLDAAIELTREKGFSAVSARSLGDRLGTTSRPIFSHFENMADVQKGIIGAANKLYQSFREEEIKSGRYVPYKASGMAYIRFAKEEKELFKLLFMRDRSGEQIKENPEEMEALIGLIAKQVNIDKEAARFFYLEMWAYTHGIASMIATGFYEWDETLASRALTDVYEGLKHRYENSFSMDELASETFAVMVLSIGLILAFVTLFLSLSSVVKGNTKTIAMMRVFGYDDTTCSRYILGAYRPISYLGFAIGTVYQYGLLRLMVSVVFSDIENVPEYSFDFRALTITLIIFVFTYELVMYLYSRSIKRLSVKSIMLE